MLEARQTLILHSQSAAVKKTGSRHLFVHKAAKVVLHLDPKCNCADRRRWLNEMGEKLGVDCVVMKMVQWMDRRKS